MPRSEILGNIWKFSQVLKNSTCGVATTIVGLWKQVRFRLSVPCASHRVLIFSVTQGYTPSVTTPPLEQEARTWLRLLFEAQLAYSRFGDQQPSTVVLLALED